jgi:hypothetical protein
VGDAGGDFVVVDDVESEGVVADEVEGLLSGDDVNEAGGVALTLTLATADATALVVNDGASRVTTDVPDGVAVADCVTMLS